MNKQLLFLLTLLPILSFSGCVVIDDGADVRGSGNALSEERTVAAFTGVSVCCGMQLILTQEEVTRVEIEAEDNLLPHILSQVRGERLVVEFEEGRATDYRPTLPIRVRVSAPTIRTLALSGGSRLTATALTTTELVLELSGGSQGNLISLVAERLELELSGGSELVGAAVETATVEIEGSGASQLAFEELTGDRLTLELSGGGEMSVDGGRVAGQQIILSGGSSYTAGELQSAQTEINGNGDATVWATEALTVDLSGSGTVDYFGSPEVSQELSGGAQIRARGER
ncbi:MAG: DUF2807 domain-containing protein [Candidatus Promineifilaceae bacterium]|nr:DUF2807 domain-containing protein [Candidatus Promineifilaceae bacterium]